MDKNTIILRQTSIKNVQDCSRSLVDIVVSHI